MEIIEKIKDTLTKNFIEYLYEQSYGEPGTFSDAVSRFNRLEYLSYVTKTTIDVHAVANIHNYHEYSKYIQENLCKYLQNHPGSVLSISDIQAVYTHDILKGLLTMYFNIPVKYYGLNVEYDHTRTEFRISHDGTDCGVLLNREQVQKLINELQRELNRG